MRVVPSTIARVLVLFLLIGALCACGIEVPADKAAYVGNWTSADMSLRISQEGRVAYKRTKAGGVSTSVDAPLKAFEGDNFVAGVGPASTTFVVSKPPYKDGDQWKMVVDDVELTKQAQ